MPLAPAVLLGLVAVLGVQAPTPPDAPAAPPVSLSRIRQALKNPVVPRLTAPLPTADFSVDILEKQRFEDLLTLLGLGGGSPMPTVLFGGAGSRPSSAVDVFAIKDPVGKIVTARRAAGARGSPARAGRLLHGARMPGAEAVTPTHAGGVVVSRRDDRLTILLTRASKPPYDWVLPKGHIDPGETPERAAEREVREETGVEADIVKALGDVSFEYKRRDVRVRYFLMRFRRTGTADESREIRWCSAADAETLLKFDSVRELVRLATADRT